MSSTYLSIPGLSGQEAAGAGEQRPVLAGGLGRRAGGADADLRKRGGGGDIVVRQDHAHGPGPRTSGASPAKG